MMKSKLCTEIASCIDTKEPITCNRFLLKHIIINTFYCDPVIIGCCDRDLWQQKTPSGESDRKAGSKQPTPMPGPFFSTHGLIECN